MLKKSMDYISAARNIEAHDWYVYLDHHKHNLKTDFSTYNLMGVIRRPERYGLTRHILSAMKGLFESGYEEVLILEDDILISKDFLEFLDLAVKLRDENTFTIAGISNEKVSVFGNDEDVTFIDWYLPWGVLYCKADYEKIKPHINDKYFSSMRAYIHNNFDELAIKNNKAFYDKCMQSDMNPMQAGFMNVFRAANNLKQMIPCQSRCQNIGYYGFNQRLKDPDGEDISLEKTWKRAMHYTPTFKDDHEWKGLGIVENKKIVQSPFKHKTKEDVMVGKSVYICPKCGFKTEAPAGTLRSCFNCNTRLEEKSRVVNKSAPAPQKEEEKEEHPKTAEGLVSQAEGAEKLADELQERADKAAEEVKSTGTKKDKKEAAKLAKGAKKQKAFAEEARAKADAAIKG